MFAQNRKTKTFDFVVSVVCLILLTSCQSPTPSVQTTAVRAPLQDSHDPQPEEADVPDIVGDLMFKLKRSKSHKSRKELVANRPVSCSLTMCEAALLKRH